MLQRLLMFVMNRGIHEKTNKINSNFNNPILFYADDNVKLNFYGNVKVATCNVSFGSNIDIALKIIPVYLIRYKASLI